MFLLDVSTLFLLCFLILMFFILYRRNANYWMQKGVHFQKALPLVGNMLDVVLMRRNMSLMIADLYFKFSNHPFFGIWIFTEPHLIVRSPDLIKCILVKDFDYFCDRNVQCNEDVDPIVSNMLFFLKNPKWKIIRSISAPMFSSGKISQVFPQFQKVSQNMVDFINTRNEKSFKANDLSAMYAVDIICSIAFGIDTYSFQDKETLLVRTAREVFHINIRNTLTSAIYFTKNRLVDIFRIKFIKTSTANFLSDTFLTILNERQSTESKRLDVLDIMIKLRKEHNLRDRELVGQASQFFLAGYETTSSTIAYAMYELAVNKDIQNKLRQEVNANIEENEGLSYDTLKRMPYLDKVVKETLRKYPIISFLGRYCMKDYAIPNSNVIIEKDTAVMIPLMGLHYDPKYFTNPNKFDPERFSPENVKGRHPYCYLPFGEGQRQCIGLRIARPSVKLALARLVRNFEMDVAEGTKIPLEFLSRTFLLHANPFSIKFKPINLTN